ncbi:MAG: hypothetical protein DRI65_01375 [Chloroflexota bacterium]|nr:MAG: hypothetical protein DRI65_01375 [Chloroflexota bacterium]
MSTNLVNWWIPIVFGYPALFLAITCSATGIYFRKPALLLLGSILSLLPSCYLGATPKLRYFGFSLPIFQILAAYLLHKQRVRLAILLQIPLIGCTIWFLALAISQ